MDSEPGYPRPLGIFVAAVLVAWGVSAQRAEPCTILCGSTTPTLSYKYVLLGRVVEAHRDSFTVEAIRVWKGGWPGDASRFRLTTETSTCGYGMVEGAYYLVVATTEPQHIALCDHQPTPLAYASKTLGQFDKTMGLAPVKLPKEAFLSPSQLQCPPSSGDAMIDRYLEPADLIVVGHLAVPKTSSPGNGAIIGNLKVMRSLKGRAAGTVSVETIRYSDESLLTDSVWFLGARLPSGVRRATSRWALESEREIVSRIERWKVLGRRCVASTTPAG